MIETTATQSSIGTQQISEMSVDGHAVVAGDHSGVHGGGHSTHASGVVAPRSGVSAVG